MKQTSNKKTSVDLVIRHTHAAVTRELRAGRGRDWQATFAFSFAGVCMLLIVAHLFWLTNSTEPTAGIVALDATDYASQTAFYGGEAPTGEVASEAVVAARESLHAAARNQTAAKVLQIFGLVLTAFTAAFLYFTRSRAVDFRIKKIR